MPLKAIRTLPLPVPPIAEQRQIVVYLDNVHTKLETARRHQKEGQKELNAMLPAILDRAFRGEL